MKASDGVVGLVLGGVACTGGEGIGRLSIIAAYVVGTSYLERLRTSAAFTPVTSNIVTESPSLLTIRNSKLEGGFAFVTILILRIPYAYPVDFPAGLQHFARLVPFPESGYSIGYSGYLEIQSTQGSSGFTPPHFLVVARRDLYLAGN